MTRAVRRPEMKPRKAKGVGLADALPAIGAPPSPPLEPLLTVADFTAEGVAKLLQRGRPSLGVFTDEAGLVFGGHGMTKETTTRTAATLSNFGIEANWTEFAPATGPASCTANAWRCT